MNGYTGLRRRISDKVVPAFAAVLFLVISLCFPCIAPAGEQESVCAEVKIEILQELTLEREAFDAHMRINNGLSHLSLEDVRIDVTFADEAGNPVFATSDPDQTDALFFIRVDTMENIDDIAGAGRVSPSTSADIHWLIIPATGSAGEDPKGTLYYVGATLSYTLGGEENTTTVTPDYIFVKPMPELSLDYFLPEDVYGDDAFTDTIEPPVPFSLGVRVKNAGFGTARKLKIDSAQPKIVENEQGLLVHFVIEKSEVGDQEAQKTLLVDFGDILPDSSKVARWIMTCTLSGKFADFEATFSHSDDLGGELTSLLKAVRTHTLVHDVLVDLPGRDTIDDFLALDEESLVVYESDNIEAPVTNQSGLSSMETIGATGPEITCRMTTPPTAGFMYVKLPDPFDGDKIINSARRADGKVIAPENVWLSRTRNPGEQTWQYFVNLFDVNTTDDYTLVFTVPEAVPQAPILQFIPDRSRTEGEELTFIVEAVDPNGTTPGLSVEPLPVGAAFSDQGDGTGLFKWLTSRGQAGEYDVTVTASDGVLSDTQDVTLTILPIVDSDNDGMPDDWEMAHFGTLDRDGTGDFDQDGISDLDEYISGTDPTVSDIGFQLPVADAGPEQVMNPTDPIVLCGANSTDTDDGVFAFEWVQIDGPEVELSNPWAMIPSFPAPDAVGTDGKSLMFRLTVTDNMGLRARDTCIVNVSSDNLPPLADAGADQLAEPGAEVILGGSASTDTDGEIAEYHWTQIKGPGVWLADPSTANPAFTAPDEMVSAGESLVFQLTVADDGGLRSRDTCVVNVSAENLPPVAETGSDQEVKENELVVLDGSGTSDPDDGIAAYRWRQLRGAPVVFSDPAAISPSFKAPAVGPEGATPVVCSPRRSAGST